MTGLDAVVLEVEWNNNKAVIVALEAKQRVVEMVSCTRKWQGW